MTKKNTHKVVTVLSRQGKLRLYDTSSTADNNKGQIFFAQVIENNNKRLLTFLTFGLRPAAFTEVSIDCRRLAGGLPEGRPWAHVSTLPVVLVGHDVVVLHRVQDLGPVQSGEVAEVWVLLDSHGTSGDVHQAVEANLSQLKHFEQHQGVVEEQVVAPDDCQVGEEVAEALQAVNPEEQQIVRDHSQLWKTEAVEILWLGLEHEQDLQVALDHSAVLQRLHVGHIVADVLAYTN